MNIDIGKATPNSEMRDIGFALLELPDVTLWKGMTNLGFEPRY